jgi:PKD repeat protein
MRMFNPLLPSSSATSPSLTVTAAVIAVILLVSNVTIVNAQLQLMNPPSAGENGISLTTTTVQSKEDSFRLQLPQGWVIHDVNNTGVALGVEALQGYGILAQLCPEEDQQQRGALPNASGSINKSNKSCQEAQDEVIHLVRYPNLGARLGFGSDDIVTREDLTADAILAYQMQKLQEVGYRDIRILNSTDTIINIIGTSLNNNAIGKVPAKLVEMTYKTPLAPAEIRQGYLISTATNATPRNLGMITGYAIFYEGSSAGTAEITPTSDNSSIPPVVKQILDSFELIVAPEVEQALLASLSAQAAEEEAQAAAEEPANSLTAEINSNDTEGVVPATFEFEAGITGGTEPYTIRWDIDDNGIVDSSEETVVPTFNEAGTYNVNLDVTDSRGQTASDNVEITVEEGEGGGAEEEPVANETEETACDSSYPDMCIPPAPPNLNCDDIGARNFEVLPPDPHGFDGDNDGIGCESGGDQPDEDELDNSGSGDSLDIRGLINQAID